MKVLSLFDGISCGQLALQRAGIAVENYWASEIESTAIAITKQNFPNTIQLGDVVKLDATVLPKQIDLLIGGSPCQSFSPAGTRTGFQGKSGLFWEFVRILETLKPKYFLLENVKMRNDWRDIISTALGVQPVLINSNLVSAQNRTRYYWTNIPNVSQPQDLQIFLSDIMQKNPGEKYTLDPSRYKLVQHQQPAPFVFREERTAEAKRLRKEYRAALGKDYVPRSAKQLVPRSDSKSNTLTTSMGKNEIVWDGSVYRKWTPVECERLQTLPDDWTAFGIDAKGNKIIIKDNRRYHAIGNGWTVDVVAHIFKKIV